MAHYSINQGSAETCQVCERMVERMLELHKQSAVVRSPLDMPENQERPDQRAFFCFSDN